MQLAFTDEQVESNVADAKDSGQSLDLLTKTLPLVGFIGGAIAFLAGLFLFLRGRRDTTAA
jgi:hypothetical protein